MDENISRAAGANHGQELDEEDFHAIVEPARPPARAAHHAVRPDPTVGQPAAPAARDRTTTPVDVVPVTLRTAACPSS